MDRLPNQRTNSFIEKGSRHAKLQYLVVDMVVLEKTFYTEDSIVALFIHAPNEGHYPTLRCATFSGDVEKLLGYSLEWDVRNEKACFTPSAKPHRAERRVLELIVYQGLHLEDVGPLVNSETMKGALLRYSLRKVLPLPETVDIQRLDQTGGAFGEHLQRDVEATFVILRRFCLSRQRINIKRAFLVV